jgi:hypothetical protein
VSDSIVARFHIDCISDTGVLEFFVGSRGGIDWPYFVSPDGVRPLILDYDAVVLDCPLRLKAAAL